MNQPRTSRSHGLYEPRSIARRIGALMAVLVWPLGSAAQCVDELDRLRSAGLDPDLIAPPTKVTIEFADAPLSDVVSFFSRWSGYSIVVGDGVQGQVSARIMAEPWPHALCAVLEAHGFTIAAAGGRILRVEDQALRTQREALAPRTTRRYPIDHVSVEQAAAALGALLSDGGRLSVAERALVLTDLPRVHDEAVRLLGDLDRAEPQVRIEARIVFIHRTRLDELGISYDLLDRRGSRLAAAGDGADGTFVQLSGPSVAALGNANMALSPSTLTVLSSLIVGRHTLVSFIEALRSWDLSEIEAAPSVTVRNQHEATIVVGERTPLRVLDAAAGAGSGSAGPTAVPQATVQIEETGIILRATPHVTRDRQIILDLHAERSAPRPAQSDGGFVFSTQNASSNVRVRDGQTIVIGGLTVAEQHRVVAGIPGLMRLPLLGRLFRSERSERIRRDLVILVTPTLIEPDS